MKTLMNAVIAAIACAVALPAAARDDQNLYPIGQVLKSPAAQGKLDPSVRLYFGGQRHPNVAREIGQWSTSRKTNAFAKADAQACEWAFLSAVIALQQRARKVGGNAVINIVSNYRNIVTSSETEYVCGAGALIAGVALKGRVVSLGGSNRPPAKREGVSADAGPWIEDSVITLPLNISNQRARVGNGARGRTPKVEKVIEFQG
jgi:uncharacterized protein YbjQ (UPF0145 family)